MSKLTIALGEYDTGWHNVQESLKRAEQVVKDAVSKSAQLVVLPEMCTTGFTMETDKYAELADGESVCGLKRIAKDAGVYLIAGVPTTDGSCNFNSSFVINPQGNVVSEYRKQRLFTYADEPDHYTAGDRSVIVNIEGVRVGLFICFDMRYPELFREVARDVDAAIVIANWPATRRKHWDVLLQSRAIENQFYMVAVNRTGEGGNLSYDGGSAIIGPRGEEIAKGPLGIGVIDTEYVAKVREEFPVLP